MSILCRMKYDERVDENNQEVIVCLPQSLQKPGKPKFRLESLGSARRQTRTELLGNEATNRPTGTANAVGHMQPHSSGQQGRPTGNLAANQNLIQPRNPNRNINVSTINNHNLIPQGRGGLLHRPVNYPPAETQRNTFSRLQAGASNYQDISVRNFQERPSMVNNNNPSYMRLDQQNMHMRTQVEAQHLIEPYDDVIMPTRQAEHQYFENYPEIMELQNQQDEFDLNHFPSSDPYIPAQWHPPNVRFQRATMQNQQRATHNADMRVMNQNRANNLSVGPGVPRNLNVGNFWPQERLAPAENMQHTDQHLGLQNSRIQLNNSNRFQRKKVFKRQRGAGVPHTQFGLQTPQRKKYNQNRSQKAKVDTMNSAGFANFNGQRRGNRYVSF